MFDLFGVTPKVTNPNNNCGVESETSDLKRDVTWSLMCLWVMSCVLLVHCTGAYLERDGGMCEI